MRTNRTEDYGNRAMAAWLTACVHVDAFRFDPKAYLIATKWWIKRKRVRARGQFAPLFSQSPKAYKLWILRQNARNRALTLRTDAHAGISGVVETKAVGTGHPGPIIALIDTTMDRTTGDPASHVAVTRQSLSSQGIVAWVVGSPDTPDLAAIAGKIDWSEEPWLMPVVAGDKIAPGTAVAYRAAIVAEEGGGQGRTTGPARIIYADDDQLDRRHRRIAPHFKPDWNSELFVHHDYLTGACIVRAERGALEAVTNIADWAQQLVARAVGTTTVANEGKQAGTPPIHLRQMLHHRAMRIAPRIPVTPAVVPTDLPPVTIIVPTRNHVDLLHTCLEGIAATDYPDIHVIVVDNNSDDAETLAYLAGLDPARHQVLHHAGPFNYSAINNRAAALAEGKLLCLLNNDIEMIAPNWLAIMARQALRADVGAVGARLLYPDGRIQHAGVTIGLGHAAGHAHRFVRPQEEGYFRRHVLPQFTSAVTAACLVVQRERFMAVGGLDERNFAVAFNDVDLCLRLNQRGWQSFYEPRATLIHHESVSRGLDQDPVGAARFAGELAALKRIWKTDEMTDPFHHPCLSRASERFAVAI